MAPSFCRSFALLLLLLLNFAGFTTFPGPVTSRRKLSFSTVDAAIEIRSLHVTGSLDDYLVDQ